MSHEWREHPKLQGRFHPDSPDDLQVVVHDGGPRLSQNAPELVWVTVTSMYGNDVFAGRVINQPQQLQTLTQGSQIKFLAPAGEHLLMVTDKYLVERGNWNIHGCNKCGLDELFDAPSDLVRVIFPDHPADASMEMFTSFCGVCGGVQVVQARNAPLQESQKSPADPKPPGWWQFWR